MTGTGKLKWAIDYLKTHPELQHVSGYKLEETVRDLDVSRFLWCAAKRELRIAPSPKGRKKIQGQSKALPPVIETCTYIFDGIKQELRVKTTGHKDKVYPFDSFKSPLTLDIFAYALKLAEFKFSQGDQIVTYSKTKREARNAA